MYFTGKLLNAEYIDYIYIAAMKDIQQNKAICDQEIKASLSKKGVIVEDFSGDIEVESTVASLLKPVFFGEIETSLDAFELGQENTLSIVRYHFLDGNITMVSNSEDEFEIKMVDKLFIEEFCHCLVPDLYDAQDEVVEQIDKEKVERVFSAKSMLVAQQSHVCVFVQADKAIYKETPSGIQKLSKETFLNDICGIIKGDHYGID